jgi:hypothetical protein
MQGRAHARSTTETAAADRVHSPGDGRRVKCSSRSGWSPIEGGARRQRTKGAHAGDSSILVTERRMDPRPVRTTFSSSRQVGRHMARVFGIRNHTVRAEASIRLRSSPRSVCNANVSIRNVGELDGLAARGPLPEAVSSPALQSRFTCISTVSSWCASHSPALVIAHVDLLREHFLC